MLAGIKSLLQSPKWRTWLFISFTLLLYYTRTRPPDPIYDIETVGNQAFLAVGKTGVVVVDLKDPEELNEISSLDTLGTVFSLQVLGSYIYLADGPDGIKMLSTDQGELNLEGGFHTPGDALDVAVAGSQVFAIDSKEDLLVLKVNENDGSFFLSSTHDLPDKAQKIKVSGNWAFISNNKNRFMIYDISIPNDPQQLSYIDLAANIENFMVIGNYAYLAASDMGLVILDISQGNEISIAGQYNQIKNARDVDVRGNYAYVAGGRDGYYVLDVSNLAIITEIGRESSLSDAQLVRIVDDIALVADDLIGLKSFYSQVLYGFREQETTNTQGAYEDIIVTGNYAYVAAGDSGVKIINIEDLNTPLSSGFIDNTDDYATSLDILGDYIYVTYRQKGLRQYNIAAYPGFLISEGVEAGIPGEPQDVRAHGNMVFVASGSEGLQIVDLSDIASPDIFSLDTPGDAKSVFILDDRAYIADGENGLQIVSINDPRSPVILQNINTFGDATSVFVSKLRDASDAERTYAFIANGFEGLYIADITDLSRPVNVATYSTRGFANDVLVQGQTVHLLTDQDGLILLDISSIDNPVLLGNQPTPGTAKRMYLREDQISFVADFDRGLRIIEAIDLNNPVEIGFFDIPVSARVILVRQNQGYMVDGQVGMWVLDLSDPLAPSILSLYPTPGQAQNLAIEGTYAYIADGTSGLQVVNISNPLNPQSEGSYSAIDNAVGVVVRGGYAYVVTGDRRRMHILDIQDVSNIIEVGVYSTAGDANNIAINGGYAYIAEGQNGIEVINIQYPIDPTLTSIGRELNLQDAQSVMFIRNHAIIADGPGGMKVYNVESPARPALVYSFPVMGGYATSLTSTGDYVLLAVDRKGIFPFDVLNLNNILYVGMLEKNEQEEFIGDEEFQALSIAALSAPAQGSSRIVNYTTSFQAGVKIFQGNGNAYTSPLGKYETPGEASLLQVITTLPKVLEGLLTGQPEPLDAKILARIFYMVYGTLLFVVLFFVYLILFSQFVLPVQTLRESFKAVTRLYASLMGEHGPVVFIKEGHTISRPGELERSGPGVARVDLNSAVVFEKRALLQPKYRQRYNQYVRRTERRGQKVPRARVEGPGVQFIEPYESIHGVADLRPQFRIRPAVQAYTRDGIEFDNPVWVLFTLGQPAEVLDVIYEGERIANNLRVAHFAEVDVPRRETIQSLTPDDAEYYERYQTIRRFFQNVKELVSEFLDRDYQESQDSYANVEKFIKENEEYADRLNLLDVLEVNQFFGHLRILSSEVGDPPKLDAREFLNTAHQLSDRLLGEMMTEFYDNVFEGRKQRGIEIKQLTDELDPDDKEEIHRYIQTQTEIRYFSNQRELASQVDFSLLTGDEVLQFVSKSIQLAARWGVYHNAHVLEFIECISGFVLEINTSDPIDVEWFFYYAGLLSDMVETERLIKFHDTINEKMIRLYQGGLRDLNETQGLSNFAKKSIKEMSEEFPLDDDLRLFNLNALELLESIKPEFDINLKKLGDDPANKVEVELLLSALNRFEYLTSNLVRFKYPFKDSYAIIADLRHSFSNLYLISNKIKLREGWKFPGFLRFSKIRRVIRDIQNSIDTLRRSSESEFDRYADLIQLSDYVQNTNKNVEKLRKLESKKLKNSSELRACVEGIWRSTRLLEHIQYPSYQRSIQRLEKWVGALNADDPAYVFFFLKQLNNLWKKIDEADQLVVQSFLRKTKMNLDMLSENVKRFGALSGSIKSDSEIRYYQKFIDKINSALKNTKISGEIGDSGSGGGERIRVGPFQFVRRRVLAAVYSKALDIDQDGEYMPWTDLPVHVAAQTFREMVAKEQYDYLYEPKDPKKYNMPKLKGNFSRAMRNQGLLAFRFIDHIDGNQLATGSEWIKDDLIYYEPRELKNPKVLRARGIKVIFSGFPDLLPVNPKIPEQFLENWQAPWTSKSDDIRGQYQLQAARVINQARTQAQRDMAHSLARILRSSKSDEALAMRVFQALEATVIDENTRQFLPGNTLSLLQTFKEWFLTDQSDNENPMLDQ